uniref:Uncharacterized protein n=1 Tax=Arundo donax TaxID=35708 RepID=A0A0A9LLE5_ARUDO
MATIPSPCSRCAKQYILAALLGVLVAITFVAAISVSLAPAHISFSIANATTMHVKYQFTLIAKNNSTRTAVSYGSLSAQIWNSPTAWIPAEVNTTAMLPEWQPPRNATNVAVWAEDGQYNEAANATANATVDGTAEQSTDCRVVVEAKVWFKYGLATRPYTVTASCLHVNFFNGTGVPVVCGSS